MRRLGRNLIRAALVPGKGCAFKAERTRETAEVHPVGEYPDTSSTGTPPTLEV